MWSAQRLLYSCKCRYDSANPQSRRRDLVELLGVFLLVLIVIWTPRHFQWPLWGLAASAIIALIAMSTDSAKALGLCTANLLRSLWLVGLASFLAVGAIVVAIRFHTLHAPATLALFFRHYAIYAVWAGIQQLILQCFFLSRSMRLLPNATAAAGVTAGLFAIAHLPNPVLTIVTLIFGLASCLFFLHYRNLWPLAIAHAILGISIAVTVPGVLLHNMRVGLGYLTYINRPTLSQTMPAPPVISPKP